MKRLLLAAALAAFSCLPAFAQGVSPVQLGYGNFTPNFGATQTLSCTTTSSSVTLANGQDTLNSELMLYSAGTGLAFMRWGNGAQTAVATDVPIPSGTVQVFAKPSIRPGQAGTQAVACITGTGTATVYVVTGFGR
jgi:hypothetical protein